MFGFRELKLRIQIANDSVECPVKGCSQCVQRQRQSFRREERFRCPEHAIYISPTTFEYHNEADNLLWKSTADLGLLEEIKKVKRESRMARDNSEDALSWNTFRYFETTHQLDAFLSWISRSEQRQAELIYWSYSSQTNDTWLPLNIARREFGENIRRSSEPDLIAVSEEGLFFIEVKLTATNDTTPSDSNNCKQYLVGGREWWRQVLVSDYKTVAIDGAKYELFRFWLLGSWLANELGKDFYLLNVVLSGRETDIEQRFGCHILEAANRQFKRITWEGIRGFVADNAPASAEKDALLSYFENKTIGYNHFHAIQQAFSPDDKTRK